MNNIAPPSTDLRQEISGYILERTAKKLKNAFQKKLKAINAGVTADQWVVLDSLRKEDGISQLEIAQEIQKDPPTLTRIIDLLDAKGLVERKNDPADRRKFNVFLTPSGKRKLQDLTPHVRDFRRESWANLSEKDLLQLKKILDVINENISIP